jgi:hypothetical protein
MIGLHLLVLEHWTSRTDATVCVAIAIGAAVAIVGPMLHRPVTAAGDRPTPRIAEDPSERQLVRHRQ